MKVAIHQPNFLPWPGYFHKYALADLMVHMDTAQHVRLEFDHRNWIKIPDGSKRWIIVHRAGSNPFAQPLNRVRLANDEWRTIIQNRLYNSYHQAPYYHLYIDNLMDVLRRKWASLASLNLALINYICQELEIATPSLRLSELGVDFGQHTGQLIRIARHAGADTYLSGMGAREYLDEGAFQKAGIKLEYQHYTPILYPQLYGEFIPNLSIIDLLFNTGPEARTYLFGGPP
ncbi:MAG: WbqC family protein [Candidatus Neomarinimicrobiota bacterium]